MSLDPLFCSLSFLGLQPGSASLCGFVSVCAPSRSLVLYPSRLAVHIICPCDRLHSYSSERARVCLMWGSDLIPVAFSFGFLCFGLAVGICFQICVDFFCFQLCPIHSDDLNLSRPYTLNSPARGPSSKKGDCGGRVQKS